MEEYLQYMKTLRTQMNDVEEQAAKLSVEEQMQITTIQTLQKDLLFAKSETRQLKEDADIMLKEKGHICSQILERQRKIGLLETDSSTLTQTLELVQRERVHLSAKLVEKSTYYIKVAEEINSNLRDQQVWMTSYKHSSKESRVGEDFLVKDKTEENSDEMKVKNGAENQAMAGDLYAVNTMITNLDAAKAKFSLVSQRKSEQISEITKLKQSIELVKHRMNDFKVELAEMDRKTLEDELQALFSDKSGETEYFQSLRNQIELLKGISHIVKCDCGAEYRVDMELSA